MFYFVIKFSITTKKKSSSKADSYAVNAIDRQILHKATLNAINLNFLPSRLIQVENLFKVKLICM